MYEELYEPLPDRDLYWKRLGLEAPQGPLDKETLDRIIFAHQCSIPFENLDSCEKHIAPSLGIVDMFQKMIAGKRGGYCFELNALFTALLEETGFDVNPVLARSLVDRGYVYPIQHRALVVTIDGQKMFCDVGYGGPMPGHAIPLIDGLELPSYGQVFRMEKVEDGPWWRLAYLGREAEVEAARRGEAEGRYLPVLEFIDARQDTVDFVALSYFSSTHPASIFTQWRMVNCRRPDGNVSIDYGKFTRNSAAGKEVKPLESDEEFWELLRTEFGIEYDRE